MKVQLESVFKTMGTMFSKKQWQKQKDKEFEVRLV